MPAILNANIDPQALQGKQYIFSVTSSLHLRKGTVISLYSLFFFFFFLILPIHHFCWIFFKISHSVPCFLIAHAFLPYIDNNAANMADSSGNSLQNLFVCLLAGLHLFWLESLKISSVERLEKFLRLSIEKSSNPSKIEKKSDPCFELLKC